MLVILTRRLMRANSLDMISCTSASDFSFTAHPADYEEYGGVSESQEFHDRFQTYEEEFHDVFRMEYAHTPTSVLEVKFRDLRDALFSLAGQVDSNIGHTQEAYRRIRLTDDRLTRTQDALCRHSDVTLQWMKEVQTLSADLDAHRLSVLTHTQVGEMIQAALVAQREELTESFLGMLHRVVNLGSLSHQPCPRWNGLSRSRLRIMRLGYRTTSTAGVLVHLLRSIPRSPQVLDLLLREHGLRLAASASQMGSTQQANPSDVY
jgi:hypothetical protein